MTCSGSAEALSLRPIRGTPTPLASALVAMARNGPYSCSSAQVAGGFAAVYRPRAVLPPVRSDSAARLDRREHRRLARMVHDAQRAGRAAERLTPRFPELTAADAAEIRDELVCRRLAAGERLV